MEIVIKDTYEEIAALAGERIAESVRARPDITLGLATGSSPLGIYDYLARAHLKGLSFKHVRTANLDEYVGLSPAHPQSYRYFMEREFFAKTGVSPKNIGFPRGDAEDLEKECERYDLYLQKWARDIQILGLGANGHIGFNEPGTPFDSVTHITELKESTRLANSRFFKTAEEVPSKAITMGIKNILDSKSIILVASDTYKAGAVKDMLEGEISVNCPACALRGHKNVTVYLDKKAAKLLR
jgi:glucosamine-6-phosphate isomerase